MPHQAAGLAAMLAARRNDLTPVALRLVPEIAAVLDRLAALPGALLARMSGSGATCFALFAARDAALAARPVLRNEQPEWWSAAGALLATPPRIEPLFRGAPGPAG
jgi:4-diphosphocytidyl-2-C-methyl-D-erythritol kinase